MEERGWSWSPSQIRQAQLIEWLAQQPAGTRLTVAGFYEALEDQSMNTSDVMLYDLGALEAQSLISRFPGLAGIPEQQIRLTQALRDRAEDLRAKRDNRGLRREQCRQAMVDWLHALDAVSATPDMPATEQMLDDPRHGMWFAEPFTEKDLDVAAAWLHRHGLVDGITVDVAEGPVRLYLTDTGVECAEDFGSDASSYIEAQQMPGSGTTVNFLGNATGVQVARDHAHQEQQIGASADELRTMITGLAELVAALVPDAAGIAGEKEAALAAAQDRAVDVSALRRFRGWVSATVGSGVSAAAAHMITSGADDMMREAIRVAGHL